MLGRGVVKAELELHTRETLAQIKAQGGCAPPQSDLPAFLLRRMSACLSHVMIHLSA
jgi:hypothetical protein